jgi:biopolymer transport protein ExbB
MKPLVELVQRGGPVMIAILCLSVVLYAQCFKLLLSVWRSSRAFDRSVPAADRQSPRRRQALDELHESFRQRRMALGAMIAAAPLLGLLGTVSGMVLTFENLSGKAANKTMEALARGISEVLVATESGLVVAIPALLLVLVANRALRKCMQKVNRIERSSPPALPI